MAKKFFDVSCFRVSELWKRLAFHEKLDSANGIFGSDFVHASWKVVNGIHAEMIRLVLFISIPQRDASRTPATSFSTTRQCPDCMKETMRGVGLPVGRLATTSDHNARPRPRFSGFAFDGCCKVHEQCHRAEDAL